MNVDLENLSCKKNGNSDRFWNVYGFGSMKMVVGVLNKKN